MTMNRLEIDGDRALFEGKLKGLAATFYENERPLQGLAGLMDWRFHGAISRCLKAGAISGKAGECVYFPVTRNGQTYHLILVGAGKASPQGRGSPIPAESLKALQKNLASLSVQQIGISRADFGGLSEDALAKHLKGAPIWILS
jgi:hypothetical protein